MATAVSITLLFATQPQTNRADMKQLDFNTLEEYIKKYIEKDLPQDAAPYLDAMYADVLKTKHTRNAVKWLDYSMSFACLYADSDSLNALYDEVLSKAWSPLRQMVILSKLLNDNNVLYNDVIDSALIDSLFDNSDGLLTSLPASEVCDTSDIALNLRVCDVIGMKLHNARCTDHNVYLRWIDLARASANVESLTLAMTVTLLNMEKIDDTSALTHITYDSLRSIAATPNAATLCNLAGIYLYIERHKEKPDNDDKLRTTPSPEEIRQVVATLDSIASYLKGVTDKYSKSDIGEVANRLHEVINAKHINLQCESIALPERPVPLVVSHRNIDSVKVDVFKDEKIVQSKTFAMPRAYNRLITTATYLEIVPLPIGEYRLRISERRGKVIDEEVLLVSGIRLSSYGIDKRHHIINIHDAATGMPLCGASVTLNNERGNTAISDSLGSVTIKCDKSRRETITVKHNNDKLSVDYYKSHVNTYDTGRSTTRCEVTTDRNIYRQGQTLHFKAYLYETSLLTNRALEMDKEVKVTLISSVNQKTIATQMLRTNRFGTVNGTFVIPDDMQKGNATVCVWLDNKLIDHALINVSDYKRTNNTITINDITETYVLGDTFMITGCCMSADKLPIVDGEVRWRAVLNITDDEERETVTEETTSTDANGCFTLAIPTQKGKKGSLQISISLTDSNGETTEHSAHYNDITDRMLRLHVSNESNYFIDQPLTLNMRTTNFCNSLQRGTVGVTLYKRVARKSYKPDIKSRFHSGTTIDNSLCDDPQLDIFADNSKAYDLVVVLPMKHIDIAGDECVTLGTVTTPGGYFVRCWLTDSAGFTYSCDKTLEVLPTDNGKACMTEELELITPKSICSDDTLTVRVGSRFDKAPIRLSVTYLNKQILHDIVYCSDNLEQVRIALPADMKVTPTDVAVHASLMRNNVLYTKSDYVEIERPKRDINVQLTTWREMTTPGAKEQWTVSILHDRPSELLASMYDIRLDKLLRPMPKVSFYEEKSGSYLPFKDLTSYIHNTRYLVKHDSYDYDYVNEEIIVKSMVSIDDDSNDMMFMVGAPRYGTMKKSAVKIRGRARVAALGTMNDADGVAEEEYAEASTEPESDVVSFADIPLRDDFRETVFFYPALYPDRKGCCSLSFDVPDNLTTYKLRLAAHDTKMYCGYVEEQLTVKKTLSIKANVPRFVREGDELLISAEVHTADPEIREVQCLMMVTDTLTGDLVDEHKIHTLSFDDKSHVATTKWRLLATHGAKTLKVVVSAKCERLTDGEVHYIEVLPSSVEVQESYPFVMWHKGKETTTVSTHDKPHVTQWRFNYSSNVFMEVLKSLPVLNKERYPSTDTYLGRVETNAITGMLKSRADVSRAVEALRNDPSLLSTPLKGTFYDHRNTEIERHTQEVIDMLDGNTSEHELAKALRKLASMQHSNGGFPWFKGMEANDFMTANVVEMLGWLTKYGLLPGDDAKVMRICKGASVYIDKQICKELREAHEGVNVMSSYDNMYMAYALTSVGGSLSDAAKDSLLSCSDTWRTLPIQKRVLLASVMWRIGQREKAHTMVRSISQNLVVEGETARLGISGLSWWDNDIHIASRVALLIKEVCPDDENYNRIINYIMLQKRTDDWGNTQATSRAVMTLLTSSTDNSSTDTVSIGQSAYEATVERPSLTITLPHPTDATPLTASVTKSNDTPSWGSWVSTSHTPISQLTPHNTEEMTVKRTLEVERNGKYMPLGNEALKVGDKVRIVITVNCDIAMDYVRITDYRASNMEPVDQLTGYRWRFRLWDWWFVPHFYSPSDTDVTFLCERLSRGEHTFCYETYITHEGTTSAGYTEAECLYSNDFKIHTEGSCVKTGVNNPHLGGAAQ